MCTFFLFTIFFSRSNMNDVYYHHIGHILLLFFVFKTTCYCVVVADAAKP